MRLLFRSLGISALFVGTIHAQNAPQNPALSSTPAGRAIQERRITNAPPVNAAGETITPEMREKLRATQEKYRDEQQKLMQKLSGARTELNAAIQAENFDEKTIREKAAVVGQV